MGVDCALAAVAEEEDDDVEEEEDDVVAVVGVVVDDDVGGFADVDAPWNRSSYAENGVYPNETVIENVSETLKTAAETKRNSENSTGGAEGGLL